MTDDKPSGLPRPPGLPPPPKPISVGNVEIPSKDGRKVELTVDQILQKHLKPIHASDPNILRFISNYLHCYDIKQAAKLTGLTYRDGKHLMTRKDIVEAIKEVGKIAAREFGYDAEETVERVKEIAFIDPVDIEREDGSYKRSLSEMSPETRRAIKKLKVKNLFGEDPNGMKTIIGEIIEIEFWDKMESLKMLGSQKQIFKETKRVEHDVSGNMRDVLLASQRRVEEIEQKQRYLNMPESQKAIVTAFTEVKEDE